MKFRKKPVVIEATQWFQIGDHPAVIRAIDGPEGISSNIELWKGTGPEIAVISTLEGNMICSPGDWVITGVNGEHYPCKPDIFLKTYDPVIE